MSKEPKVLVILSSHSKENYFSSPILSLGKELCEIGYKVFFISNPTTISHYLKSLYKPYYQGKHKKLLSNNIFVEQDAHIKNLFYVVLPLVLPINWLPKSKVYNLLSRLNSYLIKRGINILKKAYSINEYIYLNSYIPLYSLQFDKSKPQIVVYQTIDNIRESNYIDRHGEYMEPQVIQNADVVLSTSSELFKYTTQFKQAKDCYLIPNAADTQIFNKAVNEDLPLPEDLKGISRPKVIYVGNIDYRLYSSLLLELVESYDCEVILLGPEGEDIDEKEALKQHARINFLGPKKLEDVPSYLKHSQCSIIPFKVNELTKYIYPLKINEYLASGTPVVSTNFSNDIRSFEDIISVASTTLEFIEAVTEACEATYNASSVQSRLAYSQRNSWKNRAKEFDKIIQQYLR